ncbi:uncharacterized protein ASCRUDRAFT_69843 [Ascoidea rubescens DSM 1968]|uniref:Sld7 C-terminal domain-containing protein n=1 Tax=Ascoidea rubescens DSM 1968 TaxID=1344418 RepID=A0A1D2VI56_9ASCO|nr:hypothetical protein ASCRUDRAFT_69843 [Ascoidea rubescens DSM 1968]ODV61334.1 hypothetical protein ASCRUDRAFT_69843 [Ascoidea rubescens DSM 1968]
MKSLNYVQSYSLVFDPKFQLEQQQYGVLRDLQIFGTSPPIDNSTDSVLINSKEFKWRFLAIIRLEDICPVFVVDNKSSFSYQIYSNDPTSSEFFREFLVNYDVEFGLLVKLQNSGDLFLIYIDVSTNDDNNQNVIIKLIPLKLNPDVGKLLINLQKTNTNYLNKSMNNQFVDGIVLDHNSLGNQDNKDKYWDQISRDNLLIRQSSMNKQNINILDKFIKRRRLPSYLQFNANSSFIDDTDNDDNDNSRDIIVNDKNQDAKNHKENNAGADVEKLKVDIQRIILLGLRIRNISKKTNEQEFQKIYHQTYKSTGFAIRNKKQISKDELRLIVETLLTLFC